MKFSDVNESTPRIAILYKNEGGKHSFSWGMSPGLPLPHVIGYIVRVQIAITNGVAGICPCEGHDCPEVALMIAFDKESECFDWWCHKSIPVDAILGMLESIKMQFVAGTVQQRSVAQAMRILGPDGRPMR